ncbi:MAG: ribonuclease R, partial [Burkholderiaceae bacterium]
RYALGTRVRVQVSRVDLDGRKIDFRLVREGEALTARAMKDKGAPREGRAHSTAMGVPAKASTKRAAQKAAVAQEHAPRSPIQALKAAVKKVTAKKKGRKARR